MAGDILDAETRRSWLTAKGLIAPLGTTPTLTLLAETLFQVGALLNTPLQTLNGIQSVAFMLQEMELGNTAKEVAKMVTKELTPLIGRVQNALIEKSGEIMEKLCNETSELVAQTRASIKELGKITTEMNNTAEKEKATVALYQDALMQGLTMAPVWIDPRVRAKKSIQARQFLWKLSQEI